MAYSNIRERKRINIFRRVTSRFGKILIQYFPLNIVRIWGLKMCGFKVGKNVYIGSDLIVASILGDSSCLLEIGDRVAIGPRVTIVLSSDANWSRLCNTIKPIRGSVVINNDCWLGAGVIVLPNITVNEMSIVAAGAVVTKDVPPYTVVAGVPAKFVNKIEMS